jgi:hypothetical protein
VVNKHARVFGNPRMLGIITFYLLLNRARNLLFFAIQQLHTWFYATMVRNF